MYEVFTYLEKKMYLNQLTSYKFQVLMKCKTEIDVYYYYSTYYYSLILYIT